MLFSRSSGLFLSACLSVSIQQPALPAESGAKLAGCLLGQPILASLPLPETVMSHTDAEICTVHDAETQTWKRWSAEVENVGGKSQPVITFSSSDDGKTWVRQAKPCFEPSSDAKAWD